MGRSNSLFSTLVRDSKPPLPTLSAVAQTYVTLWLSARRRRGSPLGGTGRLDHREKLDKTRKYPLWYLVFERSVPTRLVLPAGAPLRKKKKNREEKESRKVKINAQTATSTAYSTATIRPFQVLTSKQTAVLCRRQCGPRYLMKS